MASVHCRSSVRPQRTAFLVSSNEPEWKSCCLQLLDLCTKTWGGYGNIIIPTDGTFIEPYFWEILEKFEPDELSVYQRSGRDILRDFPARFEECFQQHVQAWEKQIGEPSQSFQEDAIRRNLLNCPADEFSISEKLQTELRDRLSPFYFKEHVVDTVFADNDPDYPHTKTEFVLQSLKQKITEAIYLTSPHQDISLWAGTEFGYATEKTQAMLSRVGLEIIKEEGTPAVISNRLFNETRGVRSDVPRLTLSDITKANLFGYAETKYQDWSMPTIIITGDTIYDYCLYQSTSRMRGHVVWLPPSVIRDADQAKDGDRADYRRDAFMVVNNLHSFTYNTHGREFLLTSATLGVKDLEELQGQLQRYAARP